MSRYEEKPEDLIQDTKEFVRSDYGSHVMSILEAMCDGYLSRAADVELPHPERYAAKYSALKEVLDLIKSPLDDDTPTHG